MVKVFPGCATSRMGSLGLSGWVAIERDVIYAAYTNMNEPANTHICILNLLDHQISTHPYPINVPSHPISVMTFVPCYRHP